MFDHSRQALMFENQLNRFAVENKLSVRMAAGKIIRSDLESRIGPTELVDLYKLFVGIQNKFSKMFEVSCRAGSDGRTLFERRPLVKAMMRMYEFIEIEGLLPWICSASECETVPGETGDLTPILGEAHSA